MSEQQLDDKMKQQEAAYYRDAAAMQAAAVSWINAQFSLDGWRVGRVVMKFRTPPEGVLIGANLSEMRDTFCADDNARAMADHVVKVVPQCTFLMFLSLVNTAPKHIVEVVWTDGFELPQGKLYTRPQGARSTEGPN